MKNRKNFFWYFVLVAAGCLGWYLLRTTYAFTTYRVAKCTRVITLTEYSALFNRGATLVVGNYRDNAMPSHDYIVLPKLHGFDAYFECIATCEEGVIIINYNGYIPNQLVISNRIIARKVDNGTYQKLRQDSNSTLIQAY